MPLFIAAAAAHSPAISDSTPIPNPHVSLPPIAAISPPWLHPLKQLPRVLLHLVMILLPLMYFKSSKPIRKRLLDCLQSKRSRLSFLSTFSQKHDGYPSGSMVDFACDANGSPILAVSSLAVHSKDLLANPKCSLLVAKDPEDRTDLIITVHGDAVPVPNLDRDVIRTAYLAKHPDAFWVDFGDFQFLRIEPKVVRFVSGVATALLGSGEFTKEEFAAAKVDPIYQFSKPVTSHMNKDHSDDTKLMVQHSTSIPVDFAYMLDLDSLGFNVKAGYQGRSFKLRIPFPRRAENRKDVKTLIVEMLQAARSPVS